MLTALLLNPFEGMMLVIVGALATKVTDNAVVIPSTTGMVVVLLTYPVSCSRTVCDPAATFSKVAEVVAPVLLPFNKIVAPVGVELTEMLP
jgi:hypothetical protein